MATTIGLLHPGEMGSVVAAAARANGARVLWASGGRSAATRSRANAAGLEDARALSELVSESDMILSICPPANALDIAREVMSLGFGGTYVDCNAVSPATTRMIGDVVTDGCAWYVDGGIVGPPPSKSGTTRLYLSGRRARDVAALFRGSNLEAIPLDGPIGAASALKVAYASWTKGSQALILAVRAFAMHEGVDDVLVDEWARSQPDLAKRSANAVASSMKKAWRFVGEMEEIAASFDAVGLPDEFHQACAEIYRRLAGWKDTPTPPSVTEVARMLAP